MTIPTRLWQTDFQPCFLANWRLDRDLNFVDFGHFWWKSGIYKKLTCVQISSVQQFCLLRGRVRLITLTMLWNFIFIGISSDTCLRLKLFALFCIGMQPANCKWWFHGTAPTWWFLGYVVGLSVCTTERCLCVHLLYSVSFFFLFPSGASQIVSARQQLYVPQREPKYPGNQASFSL